MTARTKPGRPRIPPSERVRAALARKAGAELAERMPSGYHRMGRVLLVRLPPELKAYGATIGEAWREALPVTTVLGRAGPIEGEFRRPRVEVLAGAETVTEVTEFGIHYRFDAARVMFATGNRTERQRIAKWVAPGETVFDLFAGIGYFVLPIARYARPRRVYAVEKNPIAFGYLRENLRRNEGGDRVVPVLGDNRTADLPVESADRVLLGYLPDSRPYIPRAIALSRPEGAWFHVHLAQDVRPGLAAAAEGVVAAFERAGARVEGTPGAREVKPYGPGRSHAVVDLRARPVRR